MDDDVVDDDDGDDDGDVVADGPFSYSNPDHL